MNIFTKMCLFKFFKKLSQDGYASLFVTLKHLFHLFFIVQLCTLQNKNKHRVSSVAVVATFEVRHIRFN